MKSLSSRCLLAIAWCVCVATNCSAAPPSAAAKLPPSALPLRFVPHERVALVGNSLAERMNLFGNFESLLHTRFPRQELVVRNFARPCDAVDNRQRPSNYAAIDDPLKVFGPDTFFCFFGFNEAFAGPAGEQQFRAAYGKHLDEMAQQYPRAGGGAPRFVLVSPVAWEPTDDPLWPDANERNENLRRYAKIVAEVARERGLAFVDLFEPTEPLFAKQPGMQYTINGCHLNEAGDRDVAVALDRALFGETTAANMDSDDFQKLRAAVNDKSWVHAARLPHAQRLVRVRRPAHLGYRNLPARVSEDSRDGGRPRSLRVGSRAGQGRRLTRRRCHRRARRPRHAVRQSAAELFGAGEAGVSLAGRVRQNDEGA